jgi:gamma-glutamyltranspeptidase / glutathione hydrolase / leukotriene-C4 hydrolase
LCLREKDQVIAVNGREVAPASADTFMFSNGSNKSSTINGSSTGIPGELMGYWEAHQFAGRLQWKQLFEPVIKMAIDGYEMSKPLAAASLVNEQLIRRNKGLSKFLINPITDKLKIEGDLIQRPEYARTLQIIADKGVSAFYDGELTQTIVNEINKMGGNVTLNDFKNYKADVREPITTNITSKLKLYGHPIPSSGLLVPFILKIMYGYNLSPNDIENTNSSALFYHRLIESLKHAYAKRSYFGDDRFENMTNVIYKDKQLFFKRFQLLLALFSFFQPFSAFYMLLKSELILN